MAKRRTSKHRSRSATQRVPRSRAADRPTHALESIRPYHEELLAQTQHLLSAQRELEQLRDRYVQLYDNAPVGYVTLDRNGIIEEMNLTAAYMLGVEKQHAIRRPLLVFVIRSDRRAFLDHILRCRNSAQALSTEMTLRRTDGKVLPVQLSTRGVPRMRLGGMQYFTAITDLSERQRLEDERRLAEQQTRHVAAREMAAQAASEAKDRFLATLSHELRTPLTPILAAVTALESQEDAQEFAGTVEMIRRNVEVEARLIDDLLDVTRIARQKLQLQLCPVDVHATIRDAAQTVASDTAAKNLKLSLELNAARHIVSADPVRLRQIICNLLNNASKFTPDGGSIAVGTANADHLAGNSENNSATPSVTCGQRHSGEHLVIEVSDTGIGMDPQVLPQLFRPFEQFEQRNGERGGLGLGLAICRGLVEAHNGVIRAASPGRGLGATFTVELPVIADAQCLEEPLPAPPGQQPHPWPAAAPHLRILLVEDHLDTAHTLSRLLSAEGHTVTVAHSLSSAIAESENPFDIIISDIGLPDGSGLDLMKRIPARPDVRAIALSGYGTDQDVLRSKEAGFDEHLTKPIDFDSLLSAIGRLSQQQLH